MHSGAPGRIHVPMGKSSTPREAGMVDVASVVADVARVPLGGASPGPTIDLVERAGIEGI